MKLVAKHSIYGASCASRWRGCPGSPGVIEAAKQRGDIPLEQTTSFSEEGTEAHAWATSVLTDSMDIADIPAGFREHLAGYVEHCRHAEAEGGATARIFNEEEVPLFYKVADVGTVDHAVVHEDYIHVTDLKYGAGVKVDAVGNDQALIYTMSLVQELEVMRGYKFKEDAPVYISIHQPRHHTYSGVADTWELTVSELRNLSIEIERDYIEATEPGGELRPSDSACQFCAVKGVCTARVDASFSGLPGSLNTLGEDLPAGRGAKGFIESMQETLTPDEIGFICRNGATIKKVIDAVIESETARLQAGGEPHAMKLVAGKQGNRTWVDEAEAERFLKSLLGDEKAYKTRQIITPTQAVKEAKLLGDSVATSDRVALGIIEPTTDGVGCIVHRPEGKPRLVSVDDPAPSIDVVNAGDMFDICED